MIAYPQYLDVPMMVSVLASIEDGVSADGALRSLGIDLEGRVGSGADPTADNAIAQRHTVSSLFGRMRDGLGDQVAQVAAQGDLDALTDGCFVELSGPVTRNPMIEFVNVMERLFAIADIGAAAQSAAAQGIDLVVPEETKQVFNALRNELHASPVVDATIATDGGLTGVLSFQKSYLRHDSLDDLRFGRVRVLGKCVGTLTEDTAYNVLSRSFVGHMVSGAFTDAMSGLQQVNPEGDYPITTTVSGPGLFVVPLAVFI